MSSVTEPLMSTHLKEDSPLLAPVPAWLRYIGKAVDWSVILIGGSLAALIFINVVLHGQRFGLAHRAR
jgi:hypothetical protein